MHKKLEAELVSIAHSILQMKNRNDIVALHKKAQELHEKLSVLLFIDDYLETTPNATETKEELIAKIEKSIDKKSVEKEEIVEEIKQETIFEKPIAVEPKIEKTIFEIEKEEVIVEAKEVKKVLTLEEELKDTVSVDVTADLFQKEEKKSKASLNDKLKQGNIQVGLNDRIAFVKHLFNHSQADFNRVLSQLNTFKTEKDAQNFIKKMVKPDYDWSGKEEYEERLAALVERRFL
ncbi:MAG: hypothetical protein L3J14_02870 [Flavobacteriaceae bacterium]|nr:hypothetical protein [Flavobacteriaceae bacterium]